MPPALTMLAASPVLWLISSGLLGLLIGSFLNVVILRLPPSLFWRWRLEGHAALGESPPADEPAPPDLIFGRSRCPHCHQPLAAWQNVPVLSFLLLRGRCRHCAAPISLRYPLVELGTALLTVLVAWRFGPGLPAVAAMGFTWLMIALAGIDIEHQLLPDTLTLPGLWAGLLVAVGGLFTDPAAAILGAAAGYLLLWLIYHGFRLATGKEGLGYGDFKLLALLGAWCGWQGLPEILLLAAAVGSILGVTLIASGRLQAGQPLPFGPFLAGAGWIVLLWGDSLQQAYLDWSGL